MKLEGCCFRVIDTETTGTDPKTDRIVEAALVDVDENREIVSTWSTLVDPQIEIPPTASAVHHLTNDDVLSAPLWDDVKSSFHCGMDFVAYAAHNAPFDAAFTQIPGAWLCTERLAKHLWPDAPGHSNQVLRYWLKLKPAVDSNGAAHRALYDAICTAALLAHAMPLARAKWPHLETVEQLIALVNKPCQILRVPFKSSNYPLFTEAESGLLEWIIDKQAGGEDCIHSAREELKRRGLWYSHASEEEDDGGDLFP